MDNINYLITEASVFLAVLGILMYWLGPKSSVSKQHIYAFVASFILLLVTVPHLSLPSIGAGIFLNLGMMLIILQLSAYFSGTSANSSRLYGVILLLTAILTLSIAHPGLLRATFGRFIIAGLFWLILQQFEVSTQIQLKNVGRMEQSWLWLWIISAFGSLISPQIKILPDLFFLLLLITHFERSWSKDSIITPVISLYGLFMFWFLHLIASVSYGSGLISEAGVERDATIGILAITFMLLSIRGRRLSKSFFYLFLAQNSVLVGFEMSRLFQPSGDLILLMRLLLFISLNGLFLMIESKEGDGINIKLIEGLFKERPRFTMAILIVTLLFTIYPAMYFGGMGTMGSLLIGLVILSGFYHIFNLVKASFKPVLRPYRMLRPSLSIWATVVFIILWSTVTLLESIG